VKQATADPVALAYHELRSPLGLMVTAANALALEVPDETVQVRCEAIVRAAERMLRTASQLLAPLDAPPPDCDEAFQSWDIVRAVIEDFQALGLPVELSSTAIATETRVQGGASRFEALVGSLVMNARDHKEPGTPIRVLGAANDDTFTLDIRNKVSSVDSHKGLSLGTAICADLASHLNATVEPKSDGSEYLVRVTLQTAH
jgi:signal transduction histidine kinase